MPSMEKMSDDKLLKSENKTPDAKSTKKRYNKPELKVYGAIERHTGGGSGTMAEGTMMMGMSRFPS